MPGLVNNTDSLGTETLRFLDCTRSRRQLTFRFGLDDLHFSTSLWYGDVDFYALEIRFGREFMRKLYFHIMAFEANKLISLKPKHFDTGSFSDLQTDSFVRLWQTVYQHVWAQWRYENDLPDYAGPVPVQPVAEHSPIAVESSPGSIPLLAFCGGGKDSLVSLRLLERAEIPYASYAYSHSIYGTADRQHALIDQLLDHLHPEQRHRHWIYDDFMGAPVLDLHPELGVSTLTAAETPSSVFGVLPLILQHGYQYIGLAHERSADTGNLIWEQTGEKVNHQWGKSSAAEQLLNAYIRSELIENVSYFSLLKPIHDVLIFTLLQDDVEAVPATHSCNIEKPWCKRCPKCAYVWLNYMAYLPTQSVERIFQCNLFDLPENQLAFRQMLGLEAHTPFECIGQIDEAQLAFELCRRKGLEGAAMQTFIKECEPLDWKKVLDKYLAVYDEESAIPAVLSAKFLPVLHAKSQRAKQELAVVLELE
jgi:hypothetical protein